MGLSSDILTRKHDRMHRAGTNIQEDPSCIAPIIIFPGALLDRSVWVLHFCLM